MKKRVVMIIVFILVILLTIFILDSTNKIDITNIGSKENKNSNIINNKNENVIKDAKLKGLDLTNVSLSYVKGTGSTFAVTLTNNTNETIKIESFNIIFKDENGNVLAVLAAYVGGNIDPKQVNSIKVTAKEDISQAASVEYEEN